MGWPILSLVTFLPLLGALLIAIIRGEDENTRRNIYWTALWTTLITFLLSLFIWAGFNTAEPGFQMVDHDKSPVLCSGVRLKNEFQPGDVRRPPPLRTGLESTAVAAIQAPPVRAGTSRNV